MVVACLYKRAEAFAKLSQYDNAITELQIVTSIASSYEDTSELKLEISMLQKQHDETRMKQ